MTDLEKILGPASPGLLDPQYVVAVARFQGMVHWLLLEPENLVLDWTKWRNEFVEAGYQMPDGDVAAAQRAGIVVLDQDTAGEFFHAPEVHRLSLEFFKEGAAGAVRKCAVVVGCGFPVPHCFCRFR